MSGVESMDVTGMVALESAVDELKRHRCLAVISGVRARAAEMFDRVGLARREGVRVCADPQAALAAATAHVTPSAAESAKPPLAHRSRP